MYILKLTEELHHVQPAHPFHAQIPDEAAAKELVRQHGQADRDDLFLRHVRFAQADDQVREPSVCEIIAVFVHSGAKIRRRSGFRQSLQFLQDRLMLLVTSIVGLRVFPYLYGDFRLL